MIIHKVGVAFYIFILLYIFAIVLIKRGLMNENENKIPINLVL